MSDEAEGGGDAAPPEDCVIKETGDGETDFHPFDDMEEAYRPGPAMRVMENGLPRTVDQTTISDIPALSKESLVCMGDFSRFVIRDRWGSEALSFEARDVQRAPDGRWRVKTALVVAAATPEVEMSAVDYDGEWTEVAPVRPPCHHYVRQRAQFKLNAQHSHYARLCAARRTTEGTFMTVGDTGMWACSMREPRHLESEESLDRFDEQKIAEGKDREMLPLFQGAPPSIFDSPKG